MFECKNCGMIQENKGTCKHCQHTGFVIVPTKFLVKTYILVLSNVSASFMSDYNAMRCQGWRTLWTGNGQICMSIKKINKRLLLTWCTKTGTIEL